MVGEAGANWISPILGAPLRAIPHYMIADLAENNGNNNNDELRSSRAWYGKMFLPSLQSLIPYGDDQSTIPYEKYRELELAFYTAKQEKRDSSQEYAALLPAACGSSRRQKQHLNRKLQATTTVSSMSLATSPSERYDLGLAVTNQRQSYEDAFAEQLEIDSSVDCTVEATGEPGESHFFLIALLFCVL